MSSGEDKVIGWGVLIAIGIAIFDFDLYRHAWLIYKHRSLRWDDVVFQAKPDDCGFLRSPMGTKPCHFERVESIQWLGLGAAGQPASFFGPEPPPAGCPAYAVFVPTPCVPATLRDGEQATPQWRVRNVTFSWMKVSDKSE